MTVAVTDNLVDLATVKLWLQINDTDEDGLLSLLIPQVSTLITESCNRTHWLLSNANNPCQWAESGQNEPLLILRQWPIAQTQETCNTVSGNLTLTGFTDTSLLFVNQSVSGSGIPFGAYISSINGSLGQVTLATNFAPTATANGVTLTFGMAVFWNDLGYWNAGGGQFTPATTPNTGNLLSPGVDYSLIPDQPDGLTSRNASLFRINNLWSAQYRRFPSMLAPLQETGYGNYLVQANVGFPCIPADLQMAALMTIGKCRDSSQMGTQLASESYEAYSRSLVSQPWVKLGFLSGEVGAILARYRIGAIGVAAA